MKSPIQILHEEESSKLVVVTIIGQMDESNVDENVPKIYKIIEKLPEGSTLILNLSGLEYMNSKSIGYTSDFLAKMKEKNGDMIIAEAPPQIMDILSVVGLDKIVTFVGSVEKAKEDLKEK